MESLRSGRAGAGEWIGVLSDHVVAVLPPQSTELAARVWVALEAGAGFEEALDVVLRQGLGGVPSLVLAESRAEGALRLLVRGAPTVQVHVADGTTLLVESGPGVWREEVLGEVRGLEVDLRQGVWPSEPVGPGLRRLGAWAAGSAALDPAAPESRAQGRVDEVPLEQPLEVSPADLGRGAPGDDFDWETAPLAALVGWDDPDGPGPQASGPQTSGPQTSGLQASSPEASSAASAGHVPPVAARPAGAHWAEDEQSTDVIRAVEDAPTEVVAPYAPALAHTRVQPVAQVAFAHGPVLDLDGPVVVGRAPAPSASAFPEARTVTVPSPLGEVSANHVELYPGLGQQAGSVMVVDLGSTNGSVVRRPGQRPLSLVPGAPLPLAPGDAVDLGDGATLRIGRFG